MNQLKQYIIISTIVWTTVYTIHIEKKEIYSTTVTNPVENAILTNGKSPKIIIAQNSDISLINPFNKSIIKLKNKGRVKGGLFNNSAGSYAYCSFLNSANTKNLLTINTETGEETIINTERELIGLQDPYLIFKNPSQNEKLYYPITIKNIDDNQEITFNATTFDAQSATKGFLINKDQKKLIIGDKEKSIYTEDIISEKPETTLIIDFANKYPKNLPRTIYAQRGNTFIARSTDNKGLSKLQWDEQTRFCEPNLKNF